MDIYQAPQSQLEEDLREPGAEDASRWQRLGAYLVDVLCSVLLLIPIHAVLYANMAVDGQSYWDYINTIEDWRLNILWAASPLLFFAVNAYWYFSFGQTVGKKVLSIRIVTLDYQLPEASYLVGRYVLNEGLIYVPVVGSLLSLVNALIIFGAERRCGHDLLLNTRVIQT